MLPVCHIVKTNQVCNCCVLLRPHTSSPSFCSACKVSITQWLQTYMVHRLLQPGATLLQHDTEEYKKLQTAISPESTEQHLAVLLKGRDNNFQMISSPASAEQRSVLLLLQQCVSRQKFLNINQLPYKGRSVDMFKRKKALWEAGAAFVKITAWKQDNEQQSALRACHPVVLLRAEGVSVRVSWTQA